MELDNWGEIVSFFWPIIKYCSEIHIQVWKCKFVCNICRCSHKSMVAVLESHSFKMHLDPFAVRVPNTKACKCLILHLNLKKKSKRDKRGALSWSCLVISWSFNVLPAWSSRETKKKTRKQTKAPVAKITAKTLWELVHHTESQHRGQSLEAKPQFSWDLSFTQREQALTLSHCSNLTSNKKTQDKCASHVEKQDKQGLKLFFFFLFSSWPL